MGECLQPGPVGNGVEHSNQHSVAKDGQALRSDITNLTILVIVWCSLLAFEGARDGPNGDAAASNSPDQGDAGSPGLCTAYCELLDDCGSMVGDCHGECNTTMEAATVECTAA